MKKLIPGRFFLTGTAAQKMDLLEELYRDEVEEVLRTDPDFQDWRDAVAAEEAAAKTNTNGNETTKGPAHLVATAPDKYH